MSKVNHDIRSNQGRTMYMPEYFEGENGWGNLALPDVYAADDATTLYPRGTRLVQGERSFYYGTYRGKVDTNHSAGTVTNTDGDDLAFKCLFSVAYAQGYATGKLVRKIAGEIDVAVVDTNADIGSNVERAANWYSGGWISGKDTTPTDERMFSRRIEGHSFSATGSKTQKFWSVTNNADTVVDLSGSSNVSILRLDQPVINSKTTMAFRLHTNEWKHAIWQSDTGYHMNHAPLGACMHNDPNYGRAVWMQTYGSMFCPHLHTANFPGTATNDLRIVVMGDGSFEGRDGTYDYHSTGTFFPMVGWLLGSAVFETGGQVADSLPMIYMTLRK